MTFEPKGPQLDEAAPEIRGYPLVWPMGQARTPASERGDSRFRKLDFAGTRNEVISNLRLMDAADVIISSNVPRRKDGLPYADGDQSKEAHLDPGVAVYFTRNGKPFVFACDTYRTVSENLRAILHTIEGFRTIQRHGASAMLERAFTGFSALPPIGGSTRHWTEVLGVESNAKEAEIKARFRELARLHHPDKFKSTDEGAIKANVETFSRISRAYQEAQIERGFQ